MLPYRTKTKLYQKLCYTKTSFWYGTMHCVALRCVALRTKTKFWYKLRFCTTKFLHNFVFAQQSFCTTSFLHNKVFAQQSFCTTSFLHQLGYTKNYVFGTSTVHVQLYFCLNNTFLLRFEVISVMYIMYIKKWMHCICTQCYN